MYATKTPASQQRQSGREQTRRAQGVHGCPAQSLLAYAISWLTLRVHMLRSAPRFTHGSFRTRSLGVAPPELLPRSVPPPCRPRSERVRGEKTNLLLRRRKLILGNETLLYHVGSYGTAA